MARTYSFQEASAIISHPSYGQISIVGQGVGSITISYANDASVQDLAADGNVMTSRIKAKNGTLAINLQQTSDANRLINNMYNSLEIGPAYDWANVTVTVNLPSLGETTVCTGVSFQKKADRAYQAQGQQRTWNMLAESIQEN